MISEFRNTCEIYGIDGGIIKYIQEINTLGYRTIMSCSGMKKDHYGTHKCPFICFEMPKLSNNNEIKYLQFIGDCLFNSSWFVEYFPRYIVGYLPWGLNDSIIEQRFQKFVNNLKMRDFFKYSY
ncbi:MAG: hypothetical protein ACFFDK_16380 [Promethearchaeota archaeon]